MKELIRLMAGNNMIIVKRKNSYRRDGNRLGKRKYKLVENANVNFKINLKVRNILYATIILIDKNTI